MSRSYRRYCVSNSGLRHKPHFKSLGDSIEYCVSAALRTGNNMVVHDKERGLKVASVRPFGSNAVEVATTTDGKTVMVSFQSGERIERILGEGVDAP